MMSIQAIGKNISVLRKEKGSTQEELAKTVGVSTQAVSKWECGGTPDTELLPSIADYFNVSIDRLFGRSVGDYSDIETETAKHIASFEQEQRMPAAFEYCWTVEKALYGSMNISEATIENINERNRNGYVHSQMIFDSGITLMSLIEDMQYFIILPEPETGWKNGLFSVEEYRDLFNFLGDEDALNSLFFLYQRENKAFTPKLFEKKWGIGAEKTDSILASLKKYKLIIESEIELDDTVQKVYACNPNPAFIALLAIAKELIKKPNNYYLHSLSRNKPLL
ncbi:MAG: helix-turn-helix domain-containing protein [Oscillospiraceae bacterium]|nr:helix-turn-helix domain-containing protein [Oscillospiraceae bacterium]